MLRVHRKRSRIPFSGVLDATKFALAVVGVPNGSICLTVKPWAEKKLLHKIPARGLLTVSVNASANGGGLLSEDWQRAFYTGQQHETCNDNRGMDSLRRDGRRGDGSNKTGFVPIIRRAARVPALR